MSVSEIAHALGTPKSSTSRLLKQMLAVELLKRDKQSLAYEPAQIMIGLGDFVRARAPMLQRIQEDLGGIVAATGHTGFISVLDPTLHDVIVVRVVHGTQMLRIASEAGKRNSAVRTSTGRSLLARLSEQVIDEMFNDVLGTYSLDQSTGLLQLKGQLTEIRASGWASAINEALPHIGSVSCAVGDPNTGESWAMCLSFPAILAEQPGFVSEISRLLLRSARRLGRAAGDPVWS